LVAANIELSIGLKRAERRGWVSQMANYPLAQMIAAGVPLTFTTHMPTLFGATLSEDFTAAVALGLMTLEDVQTVTLRSLQRAQLTEEEKAELTVIFNTEIAVLLEEHAVN
jgi:adenosine deaminase